VLNLWGGAGGFACAPALYQSISAASSISRGFHPPFQASGQIPPVW